MDEGSRIIIEFIENELLEEDIELDENTSLFQDRILDSLNLVTLIGFLEKSFNIKIATSEVTIENLDSVGRMLAFLDRKADS